MAKYLQITGKVQGVGYRASFETQARILKLSGWVRNRTDGSVEALLRGEPDALDSIIEWARRGPPSAVVSCVDVAERGDDAVTDAGFVVRETR